MTALLYLCLCPLAGSSLLIRFFPSLLPCRFTSLGGSRVQLYRPFLLLPAAFCLGYLALGWTAYLAAWAFRGRPDPMAWGAAASLGLGLLLAALLPRLRRRLPFDGRTLVSGFGPAQGFALCLALAAGLFVSFYSFREDGSAVHMAVNIFSDFSPHVAVIRSFSQGANFPTQYPHFPDGTIRYHFMFLFAAGLLEYLGLPLTWAMNLPSLLCFLCLCLLLFSLAQALTGSRGAAALSLVFFFFRSSFAFFTFLAARPAEVSLGSWLLENQTFIGTTLHEDWGLFNQNVWANQRHLALGMSLAVLVLLVYLPLFTGGFARLRGLRGSALLRRFLLDRAGWLPEARLLWGLPCGVLLGAAGFWHGSMVISALLMLAGLGVFSRSRLTYLFTALPAVALAGLQSRFFTGAGSPLQVQFQVGFLAPSGAPADVLTYLLLLTGLFFPVFLAALCWGGGSSRSRGPTAAFFLAVLLPFVQAFTFTVTADVAVSHKQVMLSLILGGILNAWALTALCRRGRGAALRRTAALALAVLLTVSGLEDAVTYANRCRSGSVDIPKQDALTDWLRDETPPGSVFITGYITIHPVFTAGRFAYQGWPYYAWSAGYDTFGRDETLAGLFRQETPADFAAAASATGADYLLVDESLTADERFAAFFEAGGEELISRALPLAWQDEATRVYTIPQPRKEPSHAF